MKSIQIDRYGGAEVLVRRDIPVPTPKPGEVLIRLAHSGVNFMDVHTREGKYASSRTYPVSVPTTLGMEGAGTVVEAGAEVNDFKPGDRVAYCIVSGSVRDLDPIELGEAGSLFLTRPRLADHLPDAATIRRRTDDIFSALLDGSLEISIGGRFRLDNVEEAHEALEARRMIGKPLLDLA